MILPLLSLTNGVHGQELKTKNVILITTDGLRWQEVFTGAEQALINKEDGLSTGWLENGKSSRAARAER